MDRRRRREATPPPQPPPVTNEQRQAQCVEEFRNRIHYDPLWVETNFLTRVGLFDEVTRLLTQSGWPSLLTMYSEADVEDTSEFMGTFWYEGSEEDKGIWYKHRGMTHHCTMAQLRAVFGWPENGRIYCAPQSGWREAWGMIAPTRYCGGNSSPRDFTDPALFYLHQILSKTLFARKNSDKVGQLEISVLSMIARGDTVHWGHYFCKHLANLRMNSPISCGGMITYLLRQRHQSQQIPEHRVLQPKWADWVWFRQGRHIQVTYDGEYQWIYYNDEARRPPPVERRPAGRPRGRNARGRALVLSEEEQEAEPEQHHQPGSQHQYIPVQEQIARQFLDTVFNATRASILAGREFDIAPAPPGWNMGDPIPPQYLQPRGPPGRN